MEILDIPEDVLSLVLMSLSLGDWIEARATCRCWNRVGSLPDTLKMVIRRVEAKLLFDRSAQEMALRQSALGLMKSSFSSHVESLCITQSCKWEQSLLPGDKTFDVTLQSLSAFIASHTEGADTLALSSVATLRLLTSFNIKEVYHMDAWTTLSFIPFRPKALSSLLPHLPSLTAMHLSNCGDVDWQYPNDDERKPKHTFDGPRNYWRIFAMIGRIPLHSVTLPAWAHDNCIGFLLDTDAERLFDAIPHSDLDGFQRFRSCADPVNFPLSICALSLKKLCIEGPQRYSVLRESTLLSWISRLSQLTHLSVTNARIKEVDGQESILSLITLERLETLDLGGVVLRSNGAYFPFPDIVPRMSRLTSLRLDTSSAKEHDSKPVA